MFQGIPIAYNLTWRGLKVERAKIAKMNPQTVLGLL